MKENNLEVMNHEDVIKNPGNYDKPVVIQAYKAVIEDPSKISKEARKIMIKRLSDKGVKEIEKTTEKIRQLIEQDSQKTG